MIALRHTSCGLQLTKDSFQSAELRSDRMITSFKQGQNRCSGDIGIEFSWKEFDPFIEAAMFGAWTSNVVKCGTTTKSFTLERAFADIVQYEVFKGCMVNSWSLSIKPNAMVTGSFSITAKEAVAMTATPLDSEVTASQTELPYDGFSGTIKEGGSTIGLVTGVDIQLQNNLEALFALGSKNAAGITAGRSNITGTVSVFFQDVTMRNKFVNETPSSLEVVLGNGTTKSYTILLPRIIYSGADNAVSGEGPITLSMPWTAVYDATTGSNMQITRSAT
jgi:hypothetical protein